MREGEGVRRLVEEVGLGTSRVSGGGSGGCVLRGGGVELAEGLSEEVC